MGIQPSYNSNETLLLTQFKLGNGPRLGARGDDTHTTWNTAIKPSYLYLPLSQLECMLALASKQLLISDNFLEFPSVRVVKLNPAAPPPQLLGIEAPRQVAVGFPLSFTECPFPHSKEVATRSVSCHSCTISSDGMLLLHCCAAEDKLSQWSLLCLPRESRHLSTG